ncbi:MAG: PEP-CTERM sorting domain-containing protein [Hyphomicrobiales bacterium]|nr:PEP-CTERM sorting domain-containing protein [Hyphomicrobiales bacterium]
MYTLTDNTFGSAGTTEFSVTFAGTGGSITDNYVGALNTKDYNLNCATTGCDSTPKASYWFIDGSGSYPGDGQWLQQVGFALPAGFGLQSVTFTQVNGGDGAILAGVTLSTTTVPESSTWAMILAGFAGLGFAAYRRRKALAPIA